MIICEIGLNHLGSIDYANEYIKKIIKVRPDGITLHIREPKFYKIKKYSKLTLSDEFYFKLSKKLKKYNIKFGIGLADPTKINFCEEIGTDFYKIFGIDINNHQLIQNIIKTRKNIFISTGTSDLSEITKFVKFIKKDKKRFSLIHTQQDNHIDIVNLKAIPFLRKKFRMNVAFGNHAANTNVLYLSLAFKPTDLFFYVKGNKTNNHPDECHAIELDYLDKFISNLRELPKAIGKEIKLKIPPRI